MANVAPVHASRNFMLRDLERSGLSPDDIAVEPLPKGKAIGYRIIYPGIEGMYRDRFESGKNRYKGPAGLHGIWFRSIEEYERWSKAPRRLIVEGEKKAAAALKTLKLPAVGIGGCWGWSTGHAVDKMLLNGTGAVDIVMDGDIQNRSDIRTAAGGLARALIEHGCEVRVLALPAGAGADKVGLDDWLLAGNGRKEFNTLPELPIDELPRTKQERLQDLDRLNLDIDKKGLLITNFSNTLKIIQHLFGDVLFTDQYLGPRWDNAPYKDEVHDPVLHQALEGLHPKWPRHEIEAARRHLLAVSQKNLTGQWLTSLHWDGRPRLATFFSKFCNSSQSPEYLEDVAKSLFVGLVMRCLKPGSKFDLLVTLVGDQGVGKTLLWDRLAGPGLCVETMFSRDSDNLLRVAATAWVVNLDEFAGMSRTDERELKNWLTRTHDSWVPKYVEMSRARERAFVVVGTTNEVEHLSDTTGNRRYLPVRVGTIDLEAVGRVREQLFAEAMVLYREGHNHWAIRTAEAEQEAHRWSHPWEDEIAVWLGATRLPVLISGKTFLTMRRALWEVRVDMTGKEQQDMANVKRMGRVLRGLGYAPRRVKGASIELGSLASGEDCGWWFKGGELGRLAVIWEAKR